MLTPGQRLRALRETYGLKIRDIEAASLKIAARHHSDEFVISLSRLSDIETKGMVPGLQRLYTLAVIYRLDVRELMSWYGVDVNDTAADLKVIELAKSHRAEALNATTAAEVPLRLDPAFDIKQTMNLGRMVEQWGTLPLAFLAEFAKGKYTYGYVGTEDFTMYPILPPASFIQVDENKHEVVNRVWRSEYERPIFFVETREGFTCSWCTLKKEYLILQPHPLSPVPVRILEYPADAEVIGQVVGIAMRLGDWMPWTTTPDTPASAELN